MYTKDKWQNHWQRQDTPWAREKANDRLYEAYPQLISLLTAAAPKTADQIRVFVPLAGNSPAVRFFYDKGHTVVALEYVAEAVDRLCAEQFPEFEFSAESIQSKLHGSGRRLSAPRLTILEQDIFESTYESYFDLIYDRGGLVALGSALRPGYAATISRSLVIGGLIYLRTAIFDSSGYSGPPFSVIEDEIRQIYPLLEVIGHWQDDVRYPFADGKERDVQLLDLTLCRKL